MVDVFHRRIYVALLCLLLMAGVVAWVPVGVVRASDDILESSVFQNIYISNFDDIQSDYDAGYTYIAFICDGIKSNDYKPAIVLSKEPMYVSYSMTSNNDIICYKSGGSLVRDANFRVYTSSGFGWYECYMAQYIASNYDIYYCDVSSIYPGKIAYNARNFPDWFSIAYVDAADCPAAIPVCNLLSDFYKKDGYLAYYYYKDYPEYAFCTASDSELYVIREKSDTEYARRFVGRVSDNKIVSFRDTHDVMYVYNRKLGTWAEFKNGNSFFSPYSNSSLVTLAHAYDSLNDGNNFTLLGSNKPIRQLDFDSSGALVSETDFSPGGAIGGLPSFPTAPSPELAETVQGIRWSSMMTEVVGLIPLLVGLVISFLALRKGLAVLYHRLRRG